MTRQQDWSQTISDVHTHNINIHTGELYLHSYTSYGPDTVEEAGVEYKMATTLSKNLHIIEQQNKHKRILIHMHTIGGNWSDGMAIYDSISLFSLPVTILAYANAESMSSIILQAADTRVLMPSTNVMIHYGSGGVIGHVLSVITEAEFEKRITDKMLSIYAERCYYGDFFQSSYKSLTVDKVKTYLTNKMKNVHDWWLSSEEAVYYGFADGILGSEDYPKRSSL